MSIPPFNPQIVSGYGKYGIETAKNMYETLSEGGLGLSYNSSSRKFTVIGSSNKTVEDIQKLIAKKNYLAWVPEILNEIDSEGNRLIHLVPENINGRPEKPHIPSHPVHNYGDRNRSASQIVAYLQSIGISFVGKACIDIGCRSGENSLAMKKAGANVTGIDPDDREFGVAVEKGMEKSQLLKATLQEYREAFPDNKFDVATVFLWNIPFKEYDGFVSCLKDIIKSDGEVVIGYHDEAYNTDKSLNVPSLMQKAFGRVVKNVLEDNINKYLLICSDPKTSFQAPLAF